MAPRPGPLPGGGDDAERRRPGARGMTLEIAGGDAQERLGVALARILRPPAVVWLRGDLGAGKTTLVRGLVRALGYEGTVKSPSYTLLEPYRLAEVDVLHLDLYRLGDPEELEYLGLRDLLTPRALVLVEWPERGGDLLPPADLDLGLEHLPGGRRIACAGPRAGAVLRKLREILAGDSRFRL